MNKSLKNNFWILSAFILWLCYGCSSPDSEPWVEIYNEKDLTNWEVRDGTAKAWVENGLMVAEQTDSINFSYLVYKEELSDFILECDVKITGTLNSGILIRGLSDSNVHDGRVHGFQMEIDQTERKWTGGIYEELGRKWLTPLKGMGVGEEQAMNAYKVSDWNHYRIEAISDTFKIWVNDVPTTHLIDTKTSKGVIGYQIHKLESGNEMGFLRIKNVKVISENPEKYSKEMTLPAKMH